jgi:transcriptional regulator with XRE-family HTH domain
VIDKPRHNIARLRKALELSQRQFAKLVGIAEISVRLIETGRLKPSLDLLKRIGFVTGLPEKSDWLIRNDPSEAIPYLAHRGKGEATAEEIQENLRFSLSLCAAACLIAEEFGDSPTQNILMFRSDQFGKALTKMIGIKAFERICKSHKIKTERDMLLYLKAKIDAILSVTEQSTPPKAPKGVHSSP